MTSSRPPVFMALLLTMGFCHGQSHEEFVGPRMRAMESRSAEQTNERFDRIGRTPDDGWVSAEPRFPMADNAVRGAALAGALEALRKALSVAPHAARDPGALANAIENGCAACAKLLLEQGADPMRTLPGRLRPLAQAIALGRDAIAVQLIDSGASLGARAHDQTTALMDAVRFNRAAVARRLLDAGVDRELPDRDGRPPVVLAAELGHLDVLETLLRAGANPDAVDKDGRPAIYWAVYRKRRDAIRMLLAFGAQRGTIAVDLY